MNDTSLNFQKRYHHLSKAVAYGVEKVLTNYTSDRVLVSRLSKKLKKMNLKKTTQFKNGYRNKQSVFRRKNIYG